MDTNSPMDLGDFTNEQNTTGMIMITTVDQLVPNIKYKITIKYTSVLNDLSRGFYRSSYVENGVTKYDFIVRIILSNNDDSFLIFTLTGGWLYLISSHLMLARRFPVSTSLISRHNSPSFLVVKLK